MNLESSAIFSPCLQYRYALWRIWDQSLPTVLFICLNPSTADENKDDPTLRRCINFARTWGRGGVYVANLFAYRASHPKQLWTTNEPIGADNDRWLQELSQASSLVIIAWGQHGSLMARDKTVLPMLKHPHYLALTQQNQPRHPLYLKNGLKPIPWLRTELEKDYDPKPGNFL